MIVLFRAWLTLLLIGTDLFVISPLLPAIGDGLGVGTGAAALSVTAFSLAYLVGGPSFGALADRRGRATILRGGLVVFALANLATAVASSLAVLLVVRFVAGLSASAITPSVYAIVGDAAPAERRGRWLAITTSGLLLALCTGAPLGSALGGTIGWHGVFVAIAAASALAFAGWTVARVAQSGSASGAPTAERVPTGRRITAVAVTALWALSLYGLYTYLGTILDDHLHASDATIAAALVAYGIGAVLGGLAGGPLADRHGARRVSLVSLVALAVALLVCAAAFQSSTAVVVAALAVLALVAYPFFPAQQARLAGDFPASAGALLAWNNSAMYAGILLGSVLGSQLLTAAGPAGLAATAAAVAALATVVGARSGSTRSRRARGYRVGNVSASR